MYQELRGLSELHLLILYVFLEWISLHVNRCPAEVCVCLGQVLCSIHSEPPAGLCVCVCSVCVCGVCVVCVCVWSVCIVCVCVCVLIRARVQCFRVIIVWSIHKIIHSIVESQFASTLSLLDP